MGLKRMNLEAEGDHDHYLWLEEMESPRVMEWVRLQNERTREELQKDPRYPEFFKIIQKVIGDRERIPFGEIKGNHVYNFWQDEDHQRGIWRRIPLDLYNQKCNEWETLLDLDQFCEKRGESWAFKGAQLCPPHYRRAMVSLSKGGKDATWEMEFDVEKKCFVDGGFQLAEARNALVWPDEDTLWVTSGLEEDELTRTGYPRIVKKWRRGEKIEDAEIIYKGDKDDLVVYPCIVYTPKERLFFIFRFLDLFESRIFWVKDTELLELDVPLDAQFKGVLNGRAILLLRSNFRHFQAGHLVAFDLESKELESIFIPDKYSTIMDVVATRDALVLSLLNNVQSELGMLFPPKIQGEAPKINWKYQRIDLPRRGNIQIISSDSSSDALLVSYESFLVPPQLFKVYPSSRKKERIYSLPEQFPADDLFVDQFHAKSEDGSSIPYFVVGHKDMKFDGSNPTLLYGYGGFGISMLPHYLQITGNLWSLKKGVYVLANIRGGGEFGPSWHQSTLKENRNKSFEDFISVAEDLFRRKITSSKSLGIMGASNGGLLVGAAFTQRPELYEAAICQVPLLDMLRYHRLLTGAMSLSEFGNPDDEVMNRFWRTYSPYHQLREGLPYPQVFFLSSSKDDRVHPAHARKMCAKMLNLGHRVYYYEASEGGHGGETSLEDKAKRNALEFVFLHKTLMGSKFQL